MTRLLTALVGVPLALVAAFLVPDLWFFLIVLMTLGWASVEFAALARRFAPGAPVRALPLLVVLLALLVYACQGRFGTVAPGGDLGLLGALLALSLGAGMLILLTRTPVEQALAALGAFTFGVPYFVLPALCLAWIHHLDPWVLLLLLAIVWLGDTAAYYVGSAWGRHRMAPRLSPKKTWEGALAGVVVAVLATVAWSLWRIDGLDGWLVVLGLVTGLAGQVGDLMASMLKRGAGVKDTGNLLPGHGGVLDRLDALLFAAPTLLAGILLLGAERLGP